MESIRSQPKNEREFFEDKNGDIKYNLECLACAKSCKQSFNAHMFACKTEVKAHTPDEYIDKISKSKKTIESVAKEIKIHSSTLKSMLHERQDMTEEVYTKLEKALYNKVLK